MLDGSLLLQNYKPRPALTTENHPLERARFPIIDAHNHLGPVFGDGWAERPLAELLDAMDQAGVQALVDLDGGWSEQTLEKHLDCFKAHAPQRFFHFGGAALDQWPLHGNKFGEWTAARFREQVRRGAQGLKIWKNLGLKIRDQNDQLVPVDDERLAPLWETAADLRLPVIIHVADPVAFFDPLDEFNERWEELQAHPDWHFPSPPYPAFQSIVRGLARLVLRHPRTTFIGAHVGCYAENLAWVAQLLDRAPNFYVDISARISELGRQPYSARRFFIQYADRILFGTDVGVNVNYYRIYYRFLETQDEYFDYGPGEIPAQGRWNIHGLFLPDQVLEKVYYLNARKLFNQT